MRFCPTEIVAPRVVHWIAAPVARQLMPPTQKLSELRRTGVASVQRTATFGAREAPSSGGTVAFEPPVLRTL